jgi:sortase A
MTDDDRPDEVPGPEYDSGAGTGGVVAPARHSHGAARARLGTQDRVLLGLRGLGQTLITGGLVILLFVAYEVWISNIFASYKRHRVENDLVQAWAGNKDPLAGLPGAGQKSIPVGTAIANLYIPRFGDDFHFPIVQGTDDNSLSEGVGHYDNTPLPCAPGLTAPGSTTACQPGNFSVAGHRVGKGEPFLNMDQLKPGDAVVVQTKTEWFVYTMLGDTSTGNPGVPGTQPTAPAEAANYNVVGQETVEPSDGKVLLPVPNKPDVAPTAYLLTMTTCTPKFSATKRLIVHAYLSRAIPVSGTAIPRELTGGTL